MAKSKPTSGPPPASERAPSATPNEHIWQYLAYYFALSRAPGFAVMVNGPWGIGKSTLVRKVLKQHYPLPADESETDKPRYVYVSLFGIEKIEELDTAILHAAYPFLGNKAINVLRGVGTGLFKKYFGDPQLNAAQLLPRPDADLFVFDDLERSELSLNSALGYINRFVEHSNRKVIVIANEDGIPPEHGYWERKEKLIGQTLRVEPMVDEALSSFIEAIEGEQTRSFLRLRASEIKALFAQSESENLRILEQSLWVFSRLYSATQSKYQQNNEAMTLLLRLVLAFRLSC
jgi:hypothetical protein